jgi:hypothetical protein
MEIMPTRRLKAVLHFLPPDPNFRTIQYRTSKTDIQAIISIQTHWVFSRRAIIKFQFRVTDRAVFLIEASFLQLPKPDLVYMILWVKAFEHPKPWPAEALQPHIALLKEDNPW